MIFYHQKLKAGGIPGHGEVLRVPPSLHRGDRSMTTRPVDSATFEPGFLSQLAVFQWGRPAGLVCSPVFKAEAKVIIACYLCGTW